MDHKMPVQTTHSFPMRSHLFGLIAAGMMVFSLPAGCTPSVKSSTGQPESMADQADLVAKFTSAVKAHQNMLAGFERYASSGVVELQWTGQNGKQHREPQVNARLWFAQPRNSGIRLEKLGEELFWLGSDDDQVWFFDLFSQPTTLTLATHETQLVLGDQDHPLLIRPLALQDLLGLGELSAVESQIFGGSIQQGGQRISTLTGQVAGEGGTYELVIRADNSRLVAIRLLDDAGQRVMSSEFSRYQGARKPGVSSLSYPQVPTIIDLSDEAGRVQIKFALSQPTVDDPDQPWLAVFDRQRLQQSLRPEEIRDLNQAESGVDE